MRRPPTSWPYTLAALLALAGASTPTRADAQNGTAPSKQVASTLDGAYDREQADRGENIYRMNCASCHAMNAHAGVPFERSWLGRTAYDLFALIRSTMPMDDPGRLTPEEYADIVAYLFRINGFPAGSQPLPSDEGPLRQIRIEAKPGSAGAHGGGGRGGNHQRR